MDQKPQSLQELAAEVFDRPEDLALRLELANRLLVDEKFFFDAHEHARLAVEQAPDHLGAREILLKSKHFLYQRRGEDSYLTEAIQILEASSPLHDSPALGLLRAEILWDGYEGEGRGATALRLVLQRYPTDSWLATEAARAVLNRMPNLIEILTPDDDQALSGSAAVHPEVRECLSQLGQYAGIPEVEVSPALDLAAAIAVLIDRNSAYVDQVEACRGVFSAVDRWPSGQVEVVGHELGALARWVELGLSSDQVLERYQTLQMHPRAAGTGLLLGLDSYRGDILRDVVQRFETTTHQVLTLSEQLDAKADDLERQLARGEGSSSGEFDAPMFRLEAEKFRRTGKELDSAAQWCSILVDIVDGRYAMALGRLLESRNDQDPRHLLASAQELPFLMLREVCSYVIADTKEMVSARREIADRSDDTAVDSDLASISSVLAALRHFNEYERARQFLARIERSNRARNLEWRVRLYIERALLEHSGGLGEPLDQRVSASTAATTDGSTSSNLPEEGHADRTEGVGTPRNRLEELDSLERWAGEDADPRLFLLLSAARFMTDDLVGAQRLVSTFERAGFEMNRGTRYFHQTLVTLLHLRRAEYKKTLSTLNELARLDPFEPTTRVLTTYVHLRQGKDRMRMASLLEEELARRPDDVMPTMILVGTLLEEAASRSDRAAGIELQVRALRYLDRLSISLVERAQGSMRSELENEINLGRADLNTRIATSQSDPTKARDYLSAAEACLAQVGRSQHPTVSSYRDLIDRVRRKVPHRWPPPGVRGLLVWTSLAMVLALGVFAWSFEGARDTLLVALIVGCAVLGVAIWRGFDLSRISFGGLEMEARSLVAEAGFETPLDHWVGQLVPNLALSAAMERLIDSAPTLPHLDLPDMSMDADPVKGDPVKPDPVKGERELTN